MGGKMGRRPGDMGRRPGGGQRCRPLGGQGGRVKLLSFGDDQRKGKADFTRLGMDDLLSPTVMGPRGHERERADRPCRARRGGGGERRHPDAAGQGAEQAGWPNSRAGPMSQPTAT